MPPQSGVQGPADLVLNCCSTCAMCTVLACVLGNPGLQACHACQASCGLLLMRLLWLLCHRQERMADPVLCLGDGLTYERAVISEWLRSHSVSPMTGQPLSTRDTVPNHALRNLLQVTHC